VAVRLDESELDDDEAPASTGGVDAVRAFAALKRRWQRAALIALVVATVVAGVTMSLPARYDAAAVVQIDPRHKAITNFDPVMSEIKTDNPTIESEVEIIRSRAIALRAIDTLGMRNDPLLNTTAWWRNVGQRFGLLKTDGPALERDGEGRGSPVAGKPGEYKPERDPLAQAFADLIKVQRIRNTLLIEIKASAPDPLMAARIANALAEAYVASQVEAKTRATEAATGLLEDKLQDLRRRVAEADHKVEQYKAQHNIFDAEGQSLSEKQLSRIMEQSLQARNATAEARAKYELAQRLARKGDAGATLVDVLQSNTVRQLREQVATVSRREAELTSKYGPRHPEIQKVRAELGEARAHLAAEIERVIENLKNEFEVAEDREKQLGASLSTIKDQQVVTKDAGVELKALEREASTSRQLFEALLTRYKQAEETQGLQLPDARIVERADVPIHPAFPKRKPMLLAGLIGGILIGIAVVLARELFTLGIARPEDVESQLDLAHITSLPWLSRPGGQVIDALRSVRLVVADPGSGFADAIRSARRELDIKRASSGARIVLVASSLPGEGSGVVASNLAHHYGLTGNRVLLIDGDLRRANLTRQLAPQRAAGLLEALMTGQPAEHAILRDVTTGLHFLPATGPAPSLGSSPELLASPSMAETLKRLRGQFDTIIVEAAPLLPVIDGRMLADHADQIVLVMVWRRTPRQLAKKALRALGPNQRKVAGVIVNEVDPVIIADSQGVPVASDHAGLGKAA
jgi:exopolysaccharide transport family protein